MFLKSSVSLDGVRFIRAMPLLVLSELSCMSRTGLVRSRSDISFMSSFVISKPRLRYWTRMHLLHFDIVGQSCSDIFSDPYTQIASKERTRNADRCFMPMEEFPLICLTTTHVVNDVPKYKRHHVHK